MILSYQDDLKRPLVYVKDAARATALACCRQEPAQSSVFNVAGDCAVSLAECAQVLARLLPGLKITGPKTHPTRVRYGPSRWFSALTGPGRNWAMSPNTLSSVVLASM